MTGQPVGGASAVPASELDVPRPLRSLTVWAELRAVDPLVPAGERVQWSAIAAEVREYAGPGVEAPVLFDTPRGESDARCP